MGHLFGLPAPLHGHGSLDSIYTLRFAAPCVDIGVDHTWPDSIDPNTLGRYFFG